MPSRPTRRIERYTPPTDDECTDMLSQSEFKLARTPRLARLLGRAKAWAIHRDTGPCGRLRALGDGAIGDSVLFTNYTSSSQMSYLIAKISREVKVRFSCKRELSLIDGRVCGVRVTLTGFADARPSAMPTSTKDL